MLESYLTVRQNPILPHQTAALVFSFGSGVYRRYGLTILMSGQISFACSVLTVGCTITSSPAKVISEAVGRTEPLSSTYLVPN